MTLLASFYVHNSGKLTFIDHAMNDLEEFTGGTLIMGEDLNITLLHLKCQCLPHIHQLVDVRRTLHFTDCCFTFSLVQLLVQN